MTKERRREAGAGRGGARRTSSAKTAPTNPTGRQARAPTTEVAPHHLLIRLLKEAEKLAKDFHQDFLKCQRGRNRLRPRVRSQITNLVDTYATKVDRLRQRFSALPQDARLDVPGLWGMVAITATIRACLDRMHEALEEQQTAIAAPMDEREQRDFWRRVGNLALEMKALESFARGVRARIEREKQASEDPRLTVDEQAFTQLCEAITEFFRSYRISESTATTPSIQRVQAAASRYRERLREVRRVISNALPDSAGSVPPNRRSGGPIAEGTTWDDFEATLGCQALLLDALCQQDALHFGLPLSAEQQALQIKKVLNPALLENHYLVATIVGHTSDTQGDSDASDEHALPDYPNLSAVPKEGEQFRVLVDSGLLLHQARGPDATFDRKELQKSVAVLARKRGVRGMGPTSMWAKLNKLVELGIFRKFPARKTKANPNASDEYRLTFPSQSKYAPHAPAVPGDTSAGPSPTATSAKGRRQRI